MKIMIKRVSMKIETVNIDLTDDFLTDILGKNYSRYVDEALQGAFYVYISKDKSKPYNCNVGGKEMYGTFVIAGCDENEEVCDIDESTAHIIMEFISHQAYK